VPKASGAVRICVDMNPLNENVLRENHPMPKVDTTLAQLTGATFICDRILENHPYGRILHIKYLALKSSLKFYFLFMYGSNTVKMH